MSARMRQRLLAPSAVIVIGASFAAVSLAMGPAQVQQSATWATSGLLALSLVVSWGRGGVFSFAQGAFFGIGAYTYGVAATNLIPHTQESFSAVALAPLVALLIAALVGYFMFYGRLAQLSVAVVTLAFTLFLYTVMGSLSDPKYHIGSVVLGGYNGLGVPPLTVPGSPTGLSSESAFLAVVSVVVLATISVTLVLKRPFGRVAAAVAGNDDRAELLGYDPRWVRLRTFAFGGAVAGLAGALYASTALYIDPSVFGLAQATLVVVWVLVGGRTSVLGAFVGVALVEPLTSALGGSGGDYGPIVVGLVLIFAVLILPQGIVHSLGVAWQRLPSHRREERAAQGGLAVISGSRSPMASGRPASGTLRAHGLRKSFGGLHVTNDLSMEFTPSTISSIVGPNGAGKSTLFALLIGQYRPDAGSVHLNGQDVTRKKVFQRARAGLGIKRQVGSVFLDQTVAENLWLAAFSDTGNVSTASDRVQSMCAWLGLTSKASSPASALSHGQRQLLEIGMVLSAGPSVLLLDEPTAGMTRAETRTMAEAIRQMSQYCTVVVVEHDMEFIRELDAPVTVIHRGEVLAQGSIEDIRRNDEVLSVYLGRSHAETA